MPDVCIQLHNYDLFKKAQLKLTRIICQASPFLAKMSQNCWTHNVWTVPHFWGWGNTGDEEKSYSIPPSEKFRLIDLNLSLSKVLFLPYQKNFQKNILWNLHLWLLSFLLYHILNFRLYVHSCHANLTNNVYWMLPSAWQKHWTIEALPSKIAIPSLQCYFENPASVIACFPLFQNPFFIWNFIKLQLTPLQLGFCGLWANQI